MANYNLVVDSTFRPFTYDELSKPLVQATQLHREVEEKYGDLDMQASIWEGLADETNDPDTYALYKKYADDLHAAAESLNRYGLNPRTTAALQKLRGRYGSEIKPIETAYNRKKELIDNGLKEDVASGHTMIREYNPSDLSLDRFLHNPLADAGWSFSGVQVTKMVADMAGNLKNELTESDYRKIGIPMYYEHGQKYGYSSQKLLKLIIDRANGGSKYAQDIIGRILDNAVRATGVYELPDDSNRDRIINQLYDYGEMGLYNAIGTTKYDPLYDQYSAGAALENLRRQPAMEEKGNNGSDQPDFPVDVTDLVAGTGKIGKEDKNLSKLANGLGLLNKDGSYKSDTDWGQPRQFMSESYMGRNGSSGGSMANFPLEAKNPNGATLFNSDGTLKTREQFMSQFNSHNPVVDSWMEEMRYTGQQNINAAGKVYDRIKADIDKYINPDENGNYTMQGIRSQIQQGQQRAREKGGAYSVSAITLDLVDANDAFTTKILNPSKQGKTVSLRGLESFDKEGKVSFTGDTSKYKDFYDVDKDKLKGDVRFYLAPALGNNALVVETNHGKYVVPRSILGHNSDVVYDNYVPELQKAIKDRDNLIQQIGANYQYTGTGQTLDNTISQYKEAITAAIASSIGAKYNSVRYSTQGSRADEK